MQEMQETRVQSLGEENPWRKQQPPSVFLHRKSHGQRRLAGCNPQGHGELDTGLSTHTGILAAAVMLVILTVGWW